MPRSALGTLLMELYITRILTSHISRIVLYRVVCVPRGMRGVNQSQPTNAWNVREKSFPTVKIGISEQSIAHIVRGYYNGRKVGTWNTYATPSSFKITDDALEDRKLIINTGRLRTGLVP